jgi:pimeloyl-ACP methyl ester carboxylesterase
MHNKKTGVIFFLFLLLIQITISNNTFFKSVYSQNTTTAKMETTNTLNNLFQNTNPLDIKKVKVGDINIAYRTIGKGSPLLLIMGYAGAMNTWDTRIITKLSQNHTVIIFDNRGVGNTSSGIKNFSIPQFAQDTVGLINALHLNKPDVMGFSMGGFIAQEVALSNPEKINKLVLYATACGGNESTSLNQNLTKITQNSKSPKEFYNELIKLIFPKDWIQQNRPIVEIVKEKGFPSNMTMETLQKQYKAISSWRSIGVCNQLEKINIPTLIMVGTKDVLEPKVNSLIMSKKIPDSWLISIPDGGHAMMTQTPNTLFYVIQAFLNK